MDPPRLSAHPEGQPQGDRQPGHETGENRPRQQAPPMKPEEEGWRKLHQEIELPVDELHQGFVSQLDRQDDQDDNQDPRADLADLRQVLVAGRGGRAPVQVAREH